MSGLARPGAQIRAIFRRYRPITQLHQLAGQHGEPGAVPRTGPRRAVALFRCLRER